VYTTVQNTAIKLVNEILNFIAQDGSDPSEWYAGITDDKERRLFSEHCVKKENERLYIVFPAPDKETADLVENHLTDSVFGRVDGAPGGSSNGSFVYAYKKQPYTKP
jgi:hypothetical protein